MELSDRRATWRGFGDGFTQAFEMAVLPFAFGFIGFGADRLIGIFPVLTVALGVFGAVGSFVRSYYWYAARMDEAQKGKPWARTR